MTNSHDVGFIDDPGVNAHQVNADGIRMITVTAKSSNSPHRNIGDLRPMRSIEEIEEIAKNGNYTKLEDAEYKELQFASENREATRMKEFVNRAYNEAKRMRQEATESFKFLEELKLGFDKDAFENWTREHHEHLLPNFSPEYQKLMDQHELQQKQQQTNLPSIAE